MHSPRWLEPGTSPNWMPSPGTGNETVHRFIIPDSLHHPLGRCQFLRLPFGIVSAQDDFQRKMDETFEGIPGVTCLADDVIVLGTTQEDHDANLQATLERAAIKNLKLNPEKLTVGAQEVEYFGHIISVDGLGLIQPKLRPFKTCPHPKTKRNFRLCWE